jgi:IS1 family transposase
MKRYQIEYCTDGNSNIRHRIHRGNNSDEAVEKFLKMMKTMNLVECQIEIFKVEEI